MLDLETINAMDVDVDDDVSDHTKLSVSDDSFQELVSNMYSGWDEHTVNSGQHPGNSGAQQGHGNRS